MQTKKNHSYSDDTCKSAYKIKKEKVFKFQLNWIKNLTKHYKIQILILILDIYKNQILNFFLEMVFY